MIGQGLLTFGTFQEHRHLAMVNVRIVRILVLVETSLVRLLDGGQDRLEQTLGENLLVGRGTAAMAGTNGIRGLELQLVGSVLSGHGDRQTLGFLRRHQLEAADSAVQSGQVRGGHVTVVLLAGLV